MQPNPPVNTDAEPHPLKWTGEPNAQRRRKTLQWPPLGLSRGRAQDNVLSSTKQIFLTLSHLMLVHITREA